MMLLSMFNFIIPSRNFEGAFPKNFYSPKTCKIWPDFGRLQNSAANFFGTYAKAFEIEPRDFSAEEILLPTLMSPNQTYGAGRSHVKFCPKFLFFFLDA